MKECGGGGEGRMDKAQRKYERRKMSAAAATAAGARGGDKVEMNYIFNIGNSQNNII